MLIIRSNIFEDAVKLNICCGCGVCAGICHKAALTITDNGHGEYIPVKVDKCVKCGRCVSSCPFIEGNPSTTELGRVLFSEVEDIKEDGLLGWNLGNLVGFVNNESARNSSSSGGIATWLLCHLLETGEVDFVVCVGQNHDPKKLFKFIVCSSREEVMNCSKSAYYPVELSEVLTFIGRNEGRYALTALPCMARALRLAQKCDVNLRRRIKYIFGLTCGQMKNKQFTDYTAWFSGMDNSPLKVCYRYKPTWSKGAGDYLYRFEKKNGQFYDLPNSKIGWHWGKRLFALSACNICDDVFSELADVTFMDAWLPEYSHNSLGTNLVVVRNHQIYTLLIAGKKSGAITLSNISPEKVKQSQVGVVEFKRAPIKYKFSHSKSRMNGKREHYFTLRQILMLEHLRMWLITSSVEPRKHKFTRKNLYSGSVNKELYCWQDSAVMFIDLYRKLIFFAYRLVNKLKGINKVIWQRH